MTEDEKQKEYEIQPINLKNDFLTYNTMKKCLEFKVVGEKKIDKLYLRMNQISSPSNGVFNVHPIFGKIRKLNKDLSFLKIDFDIKKYES